MDAGTETNKWFIEEARSEDESERGKKRPELKENGEEERKKVRRFI